VTNPVSRIISRAVEVRPGEMPALLWSAAYFLLILTSYYILRPIRDEMGVVGGVENLAWLFTGTLVGMLLLHPLFTSLVTRFPRRKFIPLIYRFFIVNLVVFFLLLRGASDAQAIWIGRIFFIWVSVFNLFVVSVFWSFMTDVYRPDQSKRLFGVLAVGGTIGAILGSSITSMFVSALGPINLLLVSALFLELACRASRMLDRQEERLATEAATERAEGGAAVDAQASGVAARGAAGAGTEARARARASATGAGAGAPAAAAVPRNQGEDVIGGGTLDGVRDVLRSSYLLGIAGLMLFFTISSTFLYFQQAAITREVFGDDSESRTRFFANVDLLVNSLTLLTQLFITGRLMRWLGVGASLAFLPLISVLGFGVLAVAPVLTALVALQVVRRAGNFAIQRPAREVLYTVLSRTDKYKSKNFNDTFVYRVGDQIGAWSSTALTWMGLGIAGVSMTMVPFCAVWLGLALWLGVRYRRIHDGEAAATSRSGAVGPAEVVQGT
jgi:AAA family ATP:ADP antiporter